MKRYFIVLVALFFAMSLSLGTAQAQLVEKTPYVFVNGHSEIKVSPDEIFLSITLDEGDTKGKVSLEEQRKAMFQALKRLKIDVEKQLTVVDMSSDYFRRKSSLATTKYELKVGSAAEARECRCRARTMLEDGGVSLRSSQGRNPRCQSKGYGACRGYRPEHRSLLRDKRLYHSTQ